MKENGVLGHFPCETSHLNKKHQITVLKIFFKEYICITIICIQMMHGHIATILPRLNFYQYMQCWIATDCLTNRLRWQSFGRNDGDGKVFVFSNSISQYFLDTTRMMRIWIMSIFHQLSCLDLSTEIGIGWEKYQS